MFQHFCLLLLFIQSWTNLSISQITSDTKTESIYYRRDYVSLSNTGKYTGTFPTTQTEPMTITSTTEVETTTPEKSDTETEIDENYEYDDESMETTENPNLVEQRNESMKTTENPDLVEQKNRIKAATLYNGQSFNERERLISPDQKCILVLDTNGQIQLIDQHEAQKQRIFRWSAYYDTKRFNQSWTAKNENGALKISSEIPKKMSYVAISVKTNNPTSLFYQVSNNCILHASENDTVVWRSDMILLNQRFKANNVLYSENGTYGFLLHQSGPACHMHIIKDGNYSRISGIEACEMELTEKGVVLYNKEGAIIKETNSGRCAGADYLTVSERSGNLLCYKKPNRFFKTIVLKRRNKD